jgi:hypothetical protein
MLRYFGMVRRWGRPTAPPTVKELLAQFFIKEFSSNEERIRQAENLMKMLPKEQQEDMKILIETYKSPEWGEVSKFDDPEWVAKHEQFNTAGARLHRWSLDW